MDTSGFPRGIAARWQSLNSRQKKTLIVSGTFFILWFVLLFNPWTSPPPRFIETVSGLDADDWRRFSVALGRSVTNEGPRTALAAVVASAALPLLWRLDFWVWLVVTVGLVVYHRDWERPPGVPVTGTATSPLMGLVVVVTKRAIERGTVFEFWEAPLPQLLRREDLTIEGAALSFDNGATQRLRGQLNDSSLPSQLRELLRPALQRPEECVFVYTFKNLLIVQNGEETSPVAEILSLLRSSLGVERVLKGVGGDAS